MKVTDVVKALQIARASAFYTKPFCSPVESVANGKTNPNLFDFLKTVFAD